MTVLDLFFLSDFFFFEKFYFFYLALPVLSWSMWDLFPQPGIEPRPFTLGVWSLSHWTSREVLFIFFFPRFLVGSLMLVILKLFLVYEVQ